MSIIDKFIDWLRNDTEAKQLFEMTIEDFEAKVASTVTAQMPVIAETVASAVGQVFIDSIPQIAEALGASVTSEVGSVVAPITDAIDGIPQAVENAIKGFIPFAQKPPLHGEPL